MSGSLPTRARRCTPCSPSCPLPGRANSTRLTAPAPATWPRFPPGLLRAAYEGLAHAYDILGRTQEAETARSRSGRLITDYWVTPGDGFRFVPQRLAELAPDVHVAQGTERRPMWKPVTSAAAGLKRM
jgi:hypothetical protein